MARAHDAVKHRRIAAVLANREYEAWFIASAASLIDVRNFSCTPADCSIEAETPRNAKGWMNARMGSRGYSVTLDQPALTSCIDLELAYARSRSFRKLCDEWSRNSQPT
ncbi:conserved hypothetical protein [Burkholderiales bacterium 8X]|nr:conserved hypothetical protein [Burkholderiales bacterium 8X]